MTRASMLIARDRIAKLVGQIEAMSWSDRTVNAKWLIERLKPIESDIHDLTWPTLVVEPRRDPKGRFKRR